MRKTLVILSVCLAFWAFSCSGTDSSSEGEDLSCTTNADCQKGYRCLNGECSSIQCKEDADCLSGEYCKIIAPAKMGGCETKTAEMTDGDTEETTKSVCTEDRKDCRNNELRVCKKNSDGVLDWKFEEECAYKCEVYKVDDGFTAHCIEMPEDGDLEEEVEVEAELEPICAKGEKNCIGKTLQECSDDQMKWNDIDQCDPGFCHEDTNVTPHVVECRLCEPKTRLCDTSSQVKECSQDGKTWNKFPCLSNEKCVQAVCIGDYTCTPNRWRCENNAPQQCSSLGTEWKPALPACKSDEKCICQYADKDCTAAACQQNKICSPFFDYSCDGDWRTMCDTTGTKYTKVTDCAADGKKCVGGSCQ